MRGWLLAGVITAACWIAAPCRPATAQEGGATLALRRVLLSQAGVGYFEYAADLDGAGVLGLDLPLAQVSDALRSLVVLDGSGSVARVDLPSESAADAALAVLPVPREALNRPLDLLNALQGVTVTVAGPDPMTGRIVSAEPPPDVAGGPPVPLGDPRLGRTRVTLLTDAGLQQFVLEDAASVQVADPALRGRLQAALAALRGAAEGDRRLLEVHVDGAGRREVRVGVVLGAPLWKMTYRLTVPRDGGGPARLQAWAVLENAGLSDWRGVGLALQSGSPVAFRQDVYRTYLVDRPIVPVDMGSHDLPAVDTGAAPAAMPRRMAPMGAMAMAMPAPGLAAPPPPGPEMAPPSAPAEAEAGAVDTVFTLPRPLDLAAGHSAAVPVLDRAIPAARVGLLGYRRAHPVESVRLTNDTGTLLPPGAVTTYDGAGFTGDARVEALPPGETRLLGFASDPATSAQWQTGTATAITGLAAARGVLLVSRRQRTTTTVDIAAPATRDRALLVEIPRGPDATLSVEPPVAGVLQTATAWRLPLDLRAGQRAHLVAHADRSLGQSITMGADVGPVVALLDEPGLPEDARPAIRHLADLRRDEAGRVADRDRLLAARDAVERDEQRLRDNLAVVPAADALHARLMRDLAADEDRLANLRAQADAADGAVHAAQDALAAAVAALTF